MYHHHIYGDRLFHTRSNGYGTSVELFGSTENGEIPMSLMNIALASCVTMCVQSFWKHTFGDNQARIETSIDYEEGGFYLNVTLPALLTQHLENALRDFVAQKCRVKQLLAKDVTVVIDFHYHSKGA
ncbi:OsmC family peroxiredoxin [Streptococcus iniae]|uniref:OsmC family protein n=1 Tax=Streptococcus iniae TaxID=1346 RepID=UPI000EF6DA79|nr:OsmC family peroxiredoxin [Streptococcus iniae]RLU28472.1 OsmC family peroxiredoxin [Streptococcus iniae]RLU31170.1 OsmC family peroxiredoxin [Streptococcus iniae]RLV32963.1 OsmC family peroxiredoxin [Streptococcus iniae]